MPRGMTHCRICGKPVPSFYREDHERNKCIAGRIARGEYVSLESLKVQRKAEADKWKRLEEERKTAPQKSILLFVSQKPTGNPT